MLSTPLVTVILVACLVVGLILLWGIGNFGIGGDPKRSNKLMKARIIAQFFAVIVIVGVAWLASKGVN